MRNGAPQKYAYTPLGTGIPLQLQASNPDGGDLPLVDQTRAYLTLFCRASKWTPRFRFPWQNPIHRDPDPAKKALYGKRVRALRHTLAAFGVSKSDSEAMSHDQLVARLVEFYKAGRLPGGGVAAPTQGEGSYGGGAPAVKPDPVPDDPPPSSSRPSPTDVRAADRKVRVEGQADVDPPGPVPAVPAAPHSTGLPPWAWYMIFHYSGLTYGNAHGTYINPARLLEAFTNDMALKMWPPKSTSEPSKEDVTEAFALTCSSDAGRLLGSPAAIATIQAKLASTKAAMVGASMVQLFGALAKGAAKRFSGMTSSDGSPEGDYASLGLLRARHLCKPWDASDLAVVTGLTAWRNDVTIAGPSPKAIQDQTELFARNPTVRTAVQKGFVEAWKDRSFETLDLVTNCLVCNQTTEVAEHARGHRLDKMIADNAADAQKNGDLLPLTKNVAAGSKAGDHLFFVGYRTPRDLKGDHPGMGTRTSGWFLTKSVLVPLAKIKKLEVPLKVLVKDDDLLNTYERKMGIKDAHGKRMENVTRLSPAEQADGLYWVNLEAFTGQLSKEETAFVRLLTTTEQDVELDANGKYRLKTEPDPEKPTRPRKVMVDVRRVGIMLWSHEEIVVGANPTKLYTFTTAAEGSDGLTALRTYDLVKVEEAVLIGSVHPTEKARSELGWFLDTGAF